MIGHQCVINLRKQGRKPRSVFFFLGSYPYPKADYFNPEKALERLELPEVWVGDDDPTKVDLTFVRDLKVHLIDFGGKSTPHDYTMWWVELIKAEPRLLIGIDWDEQVNLWRKEDVIH